MKFELIEPPEPDVPGPASERAEDAAEPLEEPGEDPVAGITAAADRLAEHARAEGERIDASLAELSAVVARRASDEARTGRAQAAPPDNFRADRFTGKESAG